MPLRGANPRTFRPRSVVDALDGGEVAPGGLLVASNLVFDPSNPGCFECRPAATKIFNFSGISSPGTAVCAYTIGDICYGLIPSSLNSGHDQPFAYNIATNTLLSVSGTIDATTTPTTQSTSGDWTPPTMDVVGTLLFVTHPGFPGGVGAFFGWFDVSTPASPVWHAGNVGTNPLVAVPKAVRQFFNRAYFAVDNAVAYTDTLANNATNATQVIVVGDSSSIVALAPIPVGTSVQGILQGLAVFKNTYTAIISGDDTQGNLTNNIVSSSIGTYSPSSVAVTQVGIMFAAIDGVRSLIPDGSGGGSISDPNPDLTTPFIFMLDKTRCSAAYNNSIFRISLTNGDKAGQPVEEYWFDFKRKGWTGPHTFKQNLSVAYQDTFICFKTASPGFMYESDVVQSLTSTFVEDGNDMTYVYQTAPLQDDGGAFEGSGILTVFDLGLPGNGDSYTFLASDVIDGVLSTAVITDEDTRNTWNHFLWGTGIWSAIKYGLSRYNIDWNDSMTFTRLVIQSNGFSSLGFKIGKFVLTYKPTGYVKK